MSYYYAPPEIELVEDQRGYPGLRARNVVRDRKRRHARAAASTAAPARWTTLRIIFDAPVARPDVGQKTLASPTARANARNDGNGADAQTDDPAQALAKLQSTRASLTDYAVELDKSADAKTGYKAKYADGKDYVLATYEKTKTQVNEYAVEPTTTYATETYAYVGDKFVSTKDYAADTYDSAKTYTYDTTLSLVENAKAMTEKMMLAMGSRKEAPETVAAEAEVMEA